eukprot:2148328-Amphidinium_carterae.1
MHQPALKKHLQNLRSITQPSQEAINICSEALEALPSLRVAIGKEADELDTLTLEKGKELCQAIVQNHGQDVKLTSDASGFLIDMQCQWPLDESIHGIQSDLANLLMQHSFHGTVENLSTKATTLLHALTQALVSVDAVESSANDFLSAKGEVHLTEGLPTEAKALMENVLEALVLFGCLSMSGSGHSDKSLVDLVVACADSLASMLSEEASKTVSLWRNMAEIITDETFTMVVLTSLDTPIAAFKFFTSKKGDFTEMQRKVNMLKECKASLLDATVAKDALCGLHKLCEEKAEKYMHVIGLCKAKADQELEKCMLKLAGIGGVPNGGGKWYAGQAFENFDGLLSHASQPGGFLDGDPAVWGATRADVEEAWSIVKDILALLDEAPNPESEAQVIACCRQACTSIAEAKLLAIYKGSAGSSKAELIFKRSAVQAVKKELQLSLPQSSLGEWLHPLIFEQMKATLTMSA